MNKTMRKTIYGIEIENYLKADKLEKGVIIDGVIRLMGINRKSVIRAFKKAQMKDPWKDYGVGRDVYYTQICIAALKEIWEIGNRCCGELLHSVV